MWQVNGSIAVLSTDRLTGSLDPSRPWSGLCPCNEPPVGIRQILGVWFEQYDATVELRPLEVNVRGTDLIARYTEEHGRNVSPEIYWRVMADCAAGISGIELIASVQTSKLSSKPRLVTQSAFEPAEILQVELRCGGESRLVDFGSGSTCQLDEADSFFVVRPSNSTLSYCEMVHPSDFISSTVQQSGPEPAVRLSHELFRHALEKGVIRRGRVRGILLPRPRDIENARAHFGEFAASKPVLSA